MIPNQRLKTEYKKEEREQRARALRLEDRVDALEQENQELIDEVKRLMQEIVYIEKPWIKGD